MQGIKNRKIERRNLKNQKRNITLFVDNMIVFYKFRKIYRKKNLSCK